MKKKKEFFRIRKDRKRKNGANARACTYTATVCRFSDKRGESQPTTEKKPVDGFFIPTRVLFSKHNRPCLGKPVFCFLNLPANGKARAEALTRACVYVHKPTRRRHPKTAKKGAFALFKPYKAPTSHFMGAIDRFYVRHLFVSYSGVYGRGRAWEYNPHTPPRYQREWQGVHFNPTYIGDIEQGV